MKRKFIKARKIAISALSVIIISSQFMGCAATPKEETAETLSQSAQTETLKEDNAEQGEEKSIEPLEWVELASLTNNPEIRENWNTSLPSVNDVSVAFMDYEGKYDSNNTLKAALSVGVEYGALSALNSISTAKNGDMIFYNKALLAFYASDYYSDIDGVDFPDYEQADNLEVENEAAYNTAFLAGLNAYFNLLPDYEPAYANMCSSITRKEFMAMVFRADTPVQEIEADESFTEAVGETEYNLYAQNLKNNSYLDLESGSLDELTYNGTITRIEAIYMLVSRYYREYLQNIDIIDTNSFITNNDVGSIKLNTEFTDAKDGGTSAYEKGTEHWKSSTLNEAIQNPDKGIPTELFCALAIASTRGIIDPSEDTRWDEALTREDALQLLVNTYTAVSYYSNNVLDIASEESLDFQTKKEKEDSEMQAKIDRYKEVSMGQDTKNENSEAHKLSVEILNSRPQAEKEADAADGRLGYDVKLGDDGLHYLVDILSGEEIHIGERYGGGIMYQGEEGCKADKVYWYRLIHPSETLTDDEIAALYHIY